MRRSTLSISWRLAVLVVAATMLVAPRALTAQALREAPPRDAAPAAKNTATISGRVTNLETGRPLRRARIQITSPALPSSRSVTTNADGRYQILDLPPGPYSLTAERGGYLTLAYGQRRPGEPGKPLELADAQTVAAVDFALPRVGVISGRVVDEFGEPMAQVSMWAMQFRYYQGARQLLSVAHSSTDDSGQYRLSGLLPGEFVVMGQVRDTWPVEGPPAQMFGYAPSYYPGTIAPAEAQRVKVAVGQDVGNIDFALVAQRTSRVSGTVVNAAGLPVAGESLTLSQEVGGPRMRSIFPSSNTARTGPDGRFTVIDVQPGEYLLAVQSAAGPDQPAQEDRQVLQVAGSDIDGLVVVTGGGGTLRGQVVSDDGTPVPGLERLVVRARPVMRAAQTSTLWSAGNGRVHADGTFEFTSLVGPVVVSIETLTGDWTLKAVELHGRILADDLIDLAHGETMSGVRLVVTNRPTHVRGGLLDETQQPADGTVVIFPDESARWREDARTIRWARPDQKGQFSIKGLPAGTYRIVALDYVQDGQWYDPEFLADVRPRAERLSLAEAESTRVNLTVKK